jgi:hypothetical protein
MTKYEGSYIGHTFVARLASDPKVVIDTYTLEPTRIVDCPDMKQKVTVSSKEEERRAEAVIEAAQGAVHEHLEEQNNAQDATTRGGASVAGAAVGGLSG